MPPSLHMGGVGCIRWRAKYPSPETRVAHGKEMSKTCSDQGRARESSLCSLLLKTNAGQLNFTQLGGVEEGEGVQD